MGKSLQSAALARIIALDKLRQSRNSKLVSRTTRIAASTEQTKQKGLQIDSEKLGLKMSENKRLPLQAVVSECVKRWFQDTLKEAKSGDSSMQVLVGQMYFSGYGVPRDEQKGRAWIGKASKSRSSAWILGDKRPGYNVSDSDSDDTTNDATK